MNSKIQQSETVLLDEKSKERLAEIIAELIESNPKVIRTPPERAPSAQQETGTDPKTDSGFVHSNRGFDLPPSPQQRQTAEGKQRKGGGFGDRIHPRRAVSAVRRPENLAQRGIRVTVAELICQGTIHVIVDPARVPVKLHFVPAKASRRGGDSETPPSVSDVVGQGLVGFHGQRSQPWGCVRTGSIVHADPDVLVVRHVVVEHEFVPPLFAEVDIVPVHVRSDWYQGRLKTLIHVACEGIVIRAASASCDAPGDFNDPEWRFLKRGRFNALDVDPDRQAHCWPSQQANHKHH